MPSEMQSSPAPTNAVTRRVAMLSGQWLDFVANEDARILCWQLAADETRMLDAFLTLELDERTAEHADLFVPLEVPFASAAEHSAALCAAFTANYASDQAILLEEEHEVDWKPPPPQASETGNAYLVRLFASFAAHHALPGHVVLVLRPSAISTPDSYEAWLLELASLLPEELRFIVVDTVDAPAWSRLAADGCERVVTREAALDMPGALEEVSQNAGQLDTPGGQFRELFLQVSQALGQQDLPRALRAGQRALAITAQQGWFQLSAPIHVMLGSALAADGKKAEARQQLESAEQSALRGQTEGDPDSREACRKLRLQSRLSLGSALIAGEEYAEAARVFQDTVPVAAADGDAAVQLECYRLAAFCHERAEAPEAAFASAHAGLELAKQLPKDILATTNFPQLAAAVLALCEPAGHGAERTALEREIAALSALPSPAPADLTRGAA